QGGDSYAGSVHDSPPRQGDARKSHKQERNGKNRKKKNNSNKHSNHRNITSGKNIPDASQTGRVTGDASAWPVTLPAGVSLPGVFARADRRPPPPALKDVVTTEENSLLIRHKITDFINNLRGGFSSPPSQGRHCRPVR
ncbi:hypothetical protein ACX48G_005487, partial [Escherichia coli]